MSVAGHADTMLPLLPTQVQQQGITIRKKTPDILMMVNFTSPDGQYDDLYLSNFALVNVRDELLRGQTGLDEARAEALILAHGRGAVRPVRAACGGERSA